MLEAVAHLRESDRGGIDTPQVVTDGGAVMRFDEQIRHALDGRERCVERAAHACGAEREIVATLLHHIEPLAHDATQLMPSLDHAFEIVARVRRQGSAVFLEQELAVAEDRVYRRTELVPHVDEERFDDGHGPQ